MKLQTRIRLLLRNKLINAGTTIELPYDDFGIRRIRSVAKQSAVLEGMNVEIRTIEGRLFVKRTDFNLNGHAPLPGMEPPRPTIDRLITDLEAFRPWSNDTDASHRNNTIDGILHLLRDISEE